MSLTSKNMEMAALSNETDAEGPFYALGYFEIEKSTLTTLISTIVTYLLVIVQLKPAGGLNTLPQNISNEYN